MPVSASSLKAARKIHLYLGVFISPALLFFATTGALQTFSLHETTRGSDYRPPAWIVKLGQLHKKQTLTVPERRPQTPAAGKTGDVSPPPAGTALAAGPAAKRKNPLPMKIFFLLVSAGLATSTFTGVFMAYRYNRSKAAVTGLLAAGAAVPLLLLF